MVSRCIPQIYDLSPRSENEGRIFVEYTVVAMVHDIYGTHQLQLKCEIGVPHVCCLQYTHAILLNTCKFVCL